MTIEAVNGGVHTQPGAPEDPALVLAGPPPALMGVLSGRLELAEAERRGLRYEGDPQVLERLGVTQPAPV